MFMVYLVPKNGLPKVYVNWSKPRLFADTSLIQLQSQVSTIELPSMITDKHHTIDQKQDQNYQC